MIYTRGDSGIWACQEKLLQKIHQRASAHEISTFLFTVTKVNAVQTRETSQSLSKVLSLGNEGQVRLPCLETVLLKAISTGWGFLCDCGVHMGETDEPHKFGKGIKQLDWTCSQRLRQYSMQVLHAVVQDVLTCQKCSWRETIEISAAAPLEIFIKPEKSSAALSPPINSSAFRHSGTTPTLNHPN